LETNLADTISGARFARLRRAVVAVALSLALGGGVARLSAQDEEPAVVIPDLVGVWDGGARVRPINGPNQPWTPANFRC
jgi:hypothetical protein